MVAAWVSARWILVGASVALSGCLFPSFEGMEGNPSAEPSSGNAADGGPAAEANALTSVRLADCGVAGEEHVRDGKTLANDDVPASARLLAAVSDESNAVLEYPPAADRANLPAVSPADVDWYEFTARDLNSSPVATLSPSVELQPDPRAAKPGDTALRVCAFTRRQLVCTEGQPATGPDNLRGCCATSADGALLKVRLNIETPLADDSGPMLVRVEGVGQACAGYSLRYRGS